MDSKSLAIFLQSNDLNPETLRTEVKRVLKQIDFSTNTYTSLLASTLRILMKPAQSKKELAIRQDLDFWIEVLRFIPRMPY
jgi:hypothetical protein